MLTSTSSYLDAYFDTLDHIKEKQLTKKDMAFHLKYWGKVSEDYPDKEVYKGIINAYEDSIKG